MVDPRQELAKSWFDKALHDLIAAKTLAQSPDHLFDVAIYHCQQAAEKVLKGILVLDDVEFSKTHDILSLLTLAKELRPSLAEFEALAESLTPYAVIYRYPGEFLGPDEEEFWQALEMAQRIYDAVLALA